MPVAVDSRYRGILTALGWGATPRWAIDIAAGVIDLTTLEGRNMPGKVRIPCANARRPDPSGQRPRCKGLSVQQPAAAWRRRGTARRKAAKGLSA